MGFWCERFGPTYTYSDGVFIFMSGHNIASEDFFSELITGNTMYYTDESLDKTYHFSLNGNAEAYGWFIQECNKILGVRALIHSSVAHKYILRESAFGVEKKKL